MKLVVMGDLHYHEADKAVPEWIDARNAFYQTLLGSFLDVDADIYISLGDLTNYGSPIELQEVYKLLGGKERVFYHALGNHDLYSQPREEVLNITGQARYHFIDTERAVLVFLDTAKEMNVEDWGGWIDEKQLNWFEQVVKASGTKPLFVFAHHPVYGTTERSDMDKGSIHPSIDMWRILSQKKGTGFYFNGHTHVDSIVKEENWTFVQLSACLDQHGFRVVEITPEEIRIAAVDVQEESLMDNARILYKHMKHFGHNPDARGKDEDRETVVSLLTAMKR